MSARRFVLAAVAATATACSNPSPLDHVEAEHDAPRADRDKGFDFAGTLKKIKDGVEKPGFYEAPEHSADFDASKPHWSVLKLSGDVVERASFSFTGGKGTELRVVIERLRGLAKDDQLTGVVLRVGDLHASVPDLVELRSAMHDFRAAKKQLRCHAENAGNASYLLLAACDQIGIAPIGDVAITGPAAMSIHIKGLLDKLGVTADFIHVGAYKGAAEPLTRDAPSKEMEETLGAILDQRYATMVDIISTERKLDPDAVKGLIDRGLFTSDEAKAAKLVDEVSAFESFRDQIGAPWTTIKLDDNANALGAYLQLARFIGAMPADRPIGDHVAVVYAIGNIVDGDGGGELGAREEIAANTLVAALHALGRDSGVKAVVLRIDSGGGSAQASELIWRAVADLRKTVPVIVSMSDVAASGGYYIASGATKIFALPDTLTGSIGVVGGHIALAGALAKLGVTTFPIGRGKHATMMASYAPWTADEHDLIETSMKAVYHTFVDRVATGRNQAWDAIDKIGQGRVWTGAKAKELGLVDELGGLDAAVAAARALGKVDAQAPLELYPSTPTLRDVLHSFGAVQAPFGLHVFETALDELDPRIAASAARLLELVMTFRTTHVQTVAVLPGWSD
ncbi:MAG TPA: signal peptide peptidase SppA [Kofleriaceae bacterium]|jgi:protease-4|nr:signal peptide peptidase SppA [Kofleriaceae bacterium]